MAEGKNKAITVKVQDVETGKEISSYQMIIPINGGVISHFCCTCCTTVVFNKTTAL
jgi:ABC-type enterochelin transport system substrate-binding protein